MMLCNYFIKTRTLFTKSTQLYRYKSQLFIWVPKHLSDSSKEDFTNIYTNMHWITIHIEHAEMNGT